ncbi:hypothetical protein FS749_012232 [Ceratobasidium sp. UAMH 11750]|nr:hypothetical protein FS749_012232 [Ceratobasidium sp. UAMH 11750]
MAVISPWCYTWAPQYCSVQPRSAPAAISPHLYKILCPQVAFLAPPPTKLSAMRVNLVAAPLSCLVAKLADGTPAVAPHAPAKVLVNNDDGWTGANIRALYETLSAARYDAVLSAPERDMSGTGSTESSGTIRFGSNATDPRLNYVADYPVDATKYGMATLAPKFFGGPPDILVAGPNFGPNMGSNVQISGTVGAAVEAAKQGIPAIAFSTPDRSWAPYTDLQPGNRFYIYAQVAQRLIDTLTATAKPWLPQGVVLNVTSRGTLSHVPSPATSTLY